MNNNYFVRGMPSICDKIVYDLNEADNYIKTAMNNMKTAFKTAPDSCNCKSTINTCFEEYTKKEIYSLKDFYIDSYFKTLILEKYNLDNNKNFDLLKYFEELAKKDPFIKKYLSSNKMLSLYRDVLGDIRQDEKINKSIDDVLNNNPFVSTKMSDEERQELFSIIKEYLNMTNKNSITNDELESILGISPIKNDIYNQALNIRIVDSSGEKTIDYMSLDLYVESAMLGESCQVWAANYCSNVSRDNNLDMNELLELYAAMAITTRSYALYQTFGGTKPIHSDPNSKQNFTNNYKDIYDYESASQKIFKGTQDYNFNLTNFSATAVRAAVLATEGMIISVKDDEKGAHGISWDEYQTPFEYWSENEDNVVITEESKTLVEHPYNARYNNTGVISNAYSAGAKTRGEEKSINTLYMYDLASKKGYNYQELLKNFFVEGGGVSIKYIDYDTMTIGEKVPDDLTLDEEFDKHNIVIVPTVFESKNGSEFNSAYIRLFNPTQDVQDILTN